MAEDDRRLLVAAAVAVAREHVATLIGASPDELPILNLAGPVTGLLIQPLIGALSDRTWSEKWGRRKPFFLIGAVGCSVFLFLMPFVTALWMAVLCLWLLDASNNTAMEPYRAFIGDRLPSKQLAKGFLAQSLFIGAGSALAAGAALAVVISLGSVGLPGQVSFMATVMPVTQSMGLPVEPLGLLLAVDTIPDVFATTGNVTGDLAATTIVAKQSPEASDPPTAG